MVAFNKKRALLYNQLPIEEKRKAEHLCRYGPYDPEYFAEKAKKICYRAIKQVRV